MGVPHFARQIDMSGCKLYYKLWTETGTHIGRAVAPFEVWWSYSNRINDSSPIHTDRNCRCGSFTLSPALRLKAAGTVPMCCLERVYLARRPTIIFADFLHFATACLLWAGAHQLSQAFLALDTFHTGAHLRCASPTITPSSAEVFWRDIGR
jgi:hypothetical protein